MKCPNTVSVVIPARNAGSFLAEAVQSVLNQDHTHLECLVVDDSSTDDTAEVVRRFGPPVVYLHHESKGCAGPPRNMGIKAATGEFVLFLDADDILMPGAISSLLATLLAHPNCDLATADHMNFDASGAKPPHFRSCRRLTEALAGQPSVVLGPDDARSIMIKENFFGCCFSIHRKSSLANLRFSETLFGGEDFHFYYRLLISSPIVVLDRVLLRRRLHDSNSTRQTTRMSEDGILSRSLLLHEEPSPVLRQGLRARTAVVERMLMWSYGNDGDLVRASRLAASMVGRGSLKLDVLGLYVKAVAKCLGRRLRAS